MTTDLQMDLDKGSSVILCEQLPSFTLQASNAMPNQHTKAADHFVRPEHYIQIMHACHTAPWLTLAPSQENSMITKRHRFRIMQWCTIMGLESM